MTADEVGAHPACRGRASGVRNAALIAAMFGAALRVSETLALRPSDLDLELGMVRVRHGKGDRARTVAIDPSAQAYVERWMAMRQALGLNGGQPLFCTITSNDRFGAALDSSYVRRLLPRLAARAGIEHRVHPLALRHFAGHCVGPRGEDVTGDQRPARALVDSGDRPVPAGDRPDGTRRRCPDRGRLA